MHVHHCVLPVHRCSRLDTQTLLSLLLATTHTPLPPPASGSDFSVVWLQWEMGGGGGGGAGAPRQAPPHLLFVYAVFVRLAH